MNSTTAARYSNLVVNIACSIIDIYSMTSLIIYEVRATTRSKMVSTNQKQGKILRMICMSALTVALVHHGSGVVAFFSAHCHVLHLIWLATYAGAISLTYAFLWLRQQVVNRSPALRHEYDRCSHVLSWITLLLLLLGAILIFLSSSQLISFSRCQQQEEHVERVRVYSTILALVQLTVTVIGQGLLLSMFVMPLLRHRRRISSVLRKSKIHRPTSRSRAHIMLLVQRCVMLTAICLVSDVMAAIVTICVGHDAGKLVYDVNILVNAICCVFSFRQSRAMLFPLCYDQLITEIQIETSVTWNCTNNRPRSIEFIK